jgi:hypothetical protein
VAVATVNAVVADVMLVAELDWLLALDVLPRVVRGAVDLGQHPHGGEQYEDRPEDAQLGKKICAVMENLGHGLTPFLILFSAKSSGKAEDTGRR